MNSSIRNATKSNTYKFLDGFDYNKNDLYKIEHLMGLDKRDHVLEFVKEIEELYSTQKNHLSKIMIQRVARHFIINSKKIQRNFDVEYEGVHCNDYGGRHIRSSYDYYDRTNCSWSGD